MRYKAKGLMETRLRATERHLPYGITQCYLPSKPILTPARQAGTRFTYPGGMEG